MMEKLFDLNGRDDCVTAKIVVADRTFTIRRVVIAVRVAYANYLKEMGALLARTGQVDESDEKAVAQLQSDVETFVEAKQTLYGELLSMLLSKNGYIYDQMWWDNETDELDQRAFIEACLSKDASAVKKK